MLFSLKVVSVALLAATIVVVSNPLRRPADVIKRDIIRLTPIGSSMEDVVKVIESKEKWEAPRISHKYGYSIPYTTDPDVGEKSIRVFIGEYRNIFVTSVTVYWGFDGDEKLIDVYIWKDKDVF